MAEQDAVLAEQDLTEPVEAAETKKGKGGLLIILLPAMLISAGIGSWLAYSQYPGIAELAYNTFGGEETATQGEPLEFGEFMELSNIVVNPYDSGGRRLLMVSLGLETTEAAILESVTQREMVVRDTVIKILGNRTVDELSSIEQRTSLKSELRQAVNSIVASEGEINRLYFTQYVLQ